MSHSDFETRCAAPGAELSLAGGDEIVEENLAPESEELDAVIFYKYQATGNDFLLYGTGEENEPELTVEQVRALCDRHFGFGADGVVHAVKLTPGGGLDACAPVESRERTLASEDFPEREEAARAGLWFMDYRNADGSRAEMCGNGVRAFLTYLLDRGLVRPLTPGGWVRVATRAGIKELSLELDRAGNELVRVQMGRYRLESAPVQIESQTVRARGSVENLGTLSGCYIEMPNPHVVCAVSKTQLRAATLPRDAEEAARAWECIPPRPAGINLELVAISPEEATIDMRVCERGVGETLSCGTGCCAAAVYAHLLHPETSTWKVRVPGGELRISVGVDRKVLMSGPARFVGLVVPNEL